MRLVARFVGSAVELAIAALCALDLLWWRTYFIAACGLCFFAVSYLRYRREALLNYRFSEPIRRNMTLADVKNIETKYAELDNFNTTEKRALARPPRERYFYYARYERVRRLIDVHMPGTGRVLDMGCGYGKTTGYIEGRLSGNVVGLDLTYPKLATARAEALSRNAAHKTAFVCGDAATPPFRPASFDWIVLSEVLEHLLDPRSGLMACSDLLRDGGPIIITTPSRHSLNYSNNPFIILEKIFSLVTDKVLPHYHNLHARFEYDRKKPEPEYGIHYQFSRQQMRGLLRDAGLEVVWSGSFEIEVFPCLMIELLARGDMEFISRYVTPLESVLTRLPLIGLLGQHLLWVARKTGRPRTVRR